MMLWLYQHLLDPNFNVIQMGGSREGRGKGTFCSTDPALCLLGEASAAMRICPITL